MTPVALVPGAVWKDSKLEFTNRENLSRAAATRVRSQPEPKAWHAIGRMRVLTDSVPALEMPSLRKMSE